jgi:hypothetical protein
LEVQRVLGDPIALRELKDPTLHLEEALVITAQEGAVHFLELLLHLALAGLLWEFDHLFFSSLQN